MAPNPAVVSMRAEVPEALLGSMRSFIESHPNWDQYRLFQAALPGFLVQKRGPEPGGDPVAMFANMFQR